MNFRQIVKIVVINPIVVFVVLEGGFRIYCGVGDKTPPHADKSIHREWKWAKQHLEAGKAVIDSQFVYDPYMGWDNLPNIRTGDIRTNSAGMRADSEFTFEPKRNRLMILGDSYSFGHGVSNEETYAHILDTEHLPDWDVLNMAVSATGTAQQLIKYERYGKKYKPDVVILGFYVLNYNRNTYTFRHYAKPKFVPDGKGLRLVNSPVIPPQELYEQYRTGKRRIGGWNYSYAYASFMTPIRDHYQRSRSKGSLAWETIVRIMQRFNREVREEDSIPVWVIIPIRDIMKKTVSKYAELEERVEAAARDIGMPVLRLNDAMRGFIKEHPDRPLYRPKDKDMGGHLSFTGNKVASRAIYEFLDREKILGSVEKEKTDGADKAGHK